MNTSFFIAKRYLLAKKSHNLINIITSISVIGVGVGAFALIVVLSVFNGFEDLISSMVNQLSPELLVEPTKGKTIHLKTFPVEQIKSLENVSKFIPTITEDALFKYNENQHIGTLKGVEKSFQEMEHLGNLVTQGEFLLQNKDFCYAVPGVGVAWHLGMNINNPAVILQIYAPKRGNASTFSFENSFGSGQLVPSGVFSTQQEIDAQIVFVPFDWASKLLGFDNEATEIEIFTSQNTDVRLLKKKVKDILGDDYTVKDQFEQQETLYKIMRSEKWAIFIILTFILIMATFNVVGSLSMLILDKQKDISILKSIGANRSLLQKLFLSEGVMIAIVGGIVGLIFGIILIFLQQQFGIIKLGDGSGNFVVDAYPVCLRAVDIVIVFATVITIGLIAAFFTVKQALKKLKDDRLTAR